MKAIIESEVLLAACRTVAPALGGFRSVQSMLRFEIQADHGCIEARNDYWGIARNFTATNTEPGAVLVPSRPFQAMVSAVTGPITIRTDPSGERLQASAALTVMELRTGDADDWIAPSFTGSSAMRLPREDLVRIGQITFAAAKDLSRPLLTAVRLDGYFASATDTRRIAQAALSVDLPSISAPAEFMHDVARHATEDVEVAVGPAGIQLSDGGTTWSSTAMVGDYPDLANYLNLDPATRLDVSRTSLLTSLKRMTIFESDTAAVRMTHEGDGLKLWTSHVELGEISDQIDAQGDFQGSIWFNLRVLSEAIEAHDSEEVSMQIESPVDPVLMKGVWISQVLMPRVVKDGQADGS